MEMMEKSFSELTRTLVSSIVQVLIDAEDFEQILLFIGGRLETLSDLAGRREWTSLVPFDQSPIGSRWIRLFNEGNIDVDRQERNLQFLDRFPSMIKNTSNQLEHLIKQFKSFKETSSSLPDSSSFSSIDEEKHRLKESMDSLAEMKELWKKKVKGEE